MTPFAKTATRLFIQTAPVWLMFSPAAAAAADILRAPEPPGFAADNLRLPPRDDHGDFITLNRDAAANNDTAFWHLRIALNVAAIGCRARSDQPLVGHYNAIVARHGGLFRSTETAVIAALARATKTNGMAARDRLSTKLFNYFAQPPAQGEFCQQAGFVAAEVVQLSSAALLSRAPSLLAKLDQPFVDFYRAYDRYRIELAAYRSLANAPADRSAGVQHVAASMENRAGQ